MAVTRKMSRVAEIFLDASYVIALASKTDQHHARAVELAAWLETSQVALVTTRAVVLEIGNSLAKQRYRRSAVLLLEAIEQDARIDIVPLSEDLYALAASLYKRHEDKEWGLTDCVSFVVMRERGVQDALTTDTHFRQAGFRALLLSTGDPAPRA
jgi:predicted nucleic acid-binding protein